MKHPHFLFYIEIKYSILRTVNGLAIFLKWFGKDFCKILTVFLKTIIVEELDLTKFLNSKHRACVRLTADTGKMPTPARKIIKNL